MKKKKHYFHHLDPERAVHEKEPDIKGQGAEVQNKDHNFPEFLFGDLKRTGITIGLFIAILGILYFIIERTDYLKLVLKIFNL